MSLGGRIVSLALLNAALLATAGFVAARLHFPGLEPFLLAPAAGHMMTIVSGAVLRLDNADESEWDAIVADVGKQARAKAWLVDPVGERIAGEADPLPPELRPSFPKLGPPRGSRRGPPPPVFTVVTRDPVRYWVGGRLPVAPDGERGPMALVLASDSIFNAALFFDWRLFAVPAASAALLSALCWIPFLRGLRGSIREADRVAQAIAEGRFDVRVPEDRGDELGHLGAQINRMASRLEHYVNGQRRFLGDIAHELCAPLSRIQASIGVLELRLGPEHARRVRDLEEETEYLAGLVNELLQFSKASLARSVDLEPVAVQDAVRRAVSRESAGGAAIEVDVPDGLVVLANETLFTRSLANLVRNSIRHGGAGGPVRVSARTGGDAIEVTVADSGPGVPESEIERIFEPFYRPESSRSRQSGGVGLGLAIVKSGIESCRGSVRCRNRDPGGLEVTIRLPAAR